MKLVRTLLVMAVGALIPLVPVAAQAESHTQIDGVGDVDRTPYPIMAGGGWTTTPERADGDITSTFMAHRRRHVRAEFAFRDLDRSGPHIFRIQVKSNRFRRHISVTARRGHWRGTVRTTNGRGKKVPCRVRHDIDYRANTMVIKVSRACLGNPEWVRIGDEVVTREDGMFYLDQGGAGSSDEWVYGPSLSR